MIVDYDLCSQLAFGINWLWQSNPLNAFLLVDTHDTVLGTGNACSITCLVSSYCYKMSSALFMAQESIPYYGIALNFGSVQN